jgi:DNA-binding Lrp family transcriptional regulator
MSVKAVAWAFKAKTQNIGQTAVLAYLADLANQQGRCWACQATIAAALDTSERTVRRHMKALAAAGFIARKARYDKKKGGRTSDMTTLLIPIKLTPELPVKLTGMVRGVTGQFDRYEGGLPVKLSGNPSTKKKNLELEEEEVAPSGAPESAEVLELREEKKERNVAPSGAPESAKVLEFSSSPTSSAKRSERLYAFESGVIRLNEKDLRQWTRAFTYLVVEAELLALTDWAGKQASWFNAVAGALNKKNAAVKLAIETVKVKPIIDNSLEARYARRGGMID